MAYPRAPRRKLSVDEYLAFEQRSPLEHEYVAGEVFEMSGATRRHNTICLNISAALRPVVRVADEWVRDEIQGDGEIRLETLETSLSLDDIYRDIVLQPVGVGEGLDEGEIEVDTPW